MKTSSNRRARRVVWSLLIIIALVSSILQPAISSIFAQESADVQPADQAAQPDPDVATNNPSVDAALERPPAPDQAVVVDKSNPNWLTVYGTEAGRQLLPPRQSEVPAAADGAMPVLSGFWISRTISAGISGVTAAAYYSPTGRLYTALYNQGLRVYGPDASGIYGWTPITATLGGLLSNNVTALAVFGSQLWIGTASSGISVYNLSTGAWTSYTATVGGLPSNAINRLTPVGTSYIWVSTNGSGAAKFTPGRPGTWNIINSVDSVLIDNTMYDVAVDINGATTTTWFAHRSGLTSWNGTTFTAQGGGNCIPWDYARRVMVDRQHRVWYVPVQIIPARLQGPNQPAASVEQAIGVCLRTSSSSYTLYNSSSPGLPNTDVTDLSEDYAGRVWMAMRGSNGGGAVNDNGTWKAYTVSSSPVISNNMSTVLAVGEAVWWGQNTLNAFSVHSPNWRRFDATQIGDTPESIFLDTSIISRTWVGGTTKIAYTDGAAWTSIPVPGNTYTVTAFTRIVTGNLWFGTNGNGVYEYDNANFTHYTTAGGLPSNIVNTLLTDQANRVWVGTNGGLAMRAEAGYWLTFTTSTAPLVGNFIQSLARDSADRLWIGTSSGLSIYNPAGGNNAWLTYTTANGLPANSITGISAAPDGSMWLSTLGGGVAVTNPVSSTWTIYTTTAGLPSSSDMDITHDPTGRAWVSTSGGLALRQGGIWSSFKVPSSALDSHHLDGVAADANRTWVEGDTTIAMRGVLTSPIGLPAPTISSFSPISATAGAVIVITGTNFDNRGPEFNVVKFATGPYKVTTLAAEVVSATATTLTVKVPALAVSGKLQVEANGWKSSSIASFQLMPKITSLNASCLSLGSELKISGLGFLDGSAAAYVKIGNGAERIADATDPTQVRVFIRPGDTNGQVRVRLLNTNQSIANQSLSLATIAVNQTKVQQAIEGERLIWGKRTLVQLGATSGGCGNAKITSARLAWKFSGGVEISGAYVNYPNGKTLPLSLPNFSLDNAVSLAAALDLHDVAYELNLNGSSSSVPYFTGADVVLSNNYIKVYTATISSATFNFLDTSAVRRRLIAMMITGDTPAEQDPNFDQNMYAGMDAVARIYPQQDAWATGGKYSWLHSTPFWYSLSYKVNIAAQNGNQDEARELVEDFLDPGGQYWAVALIDRMNLASGSAGGLSASGWRTVLAANSVNLSGRYMAHETLHAFGFVDSDAANYQPSNVPGEDNHSKYNEGRWGTFGDCSSTRTFRQALQDFTSSPDRAVVRLGNSSTPVAMITAACTTDAGKNQTDTAKSVISYAPNRSNFNTVMEPVDYRELIKILCEGGGCYGYNAQAKAPNGLAAPKATTVATRTLRLSGKIDVSGTVTTSLSYVGIDDGEVTPQEPGGTHHLIIRDAGSTILHDQIFQIEEETLTPHDTALNSGLAHGGQQPEHAPNPVSLFHLRVPFPDNAVSAEIVYSGTVLWSKSVSANAPTVSITEPSGGTFNAGSPITVTWTANDIDNDPLQFGLDYSADNGVTWLSINPKIIGNSLVWTPGYVTATNTARVRVRASDGFNTGFATSAQFALTAKAPKAIILAPEAGETFAEGETIELKGMSLTNAGQDEGVFTWKINNASVGNTRAISAPLNAIGVNTITLQVDTNAMSGTQSITVTVIPDYDRDRMPNDWEQQYQFNPLDASDATGDADSDTLSNLDEYRLGTNPRSADTDGDGYSDSAEINAGTDPLDPASHPIATPILNVGSVSMGFTFNDYSPIPGPKTTWVTNLGTGSINWTATTDTPWLNVQPISGNAPQEIFVSANANGVPVGVYQGHVTVSATGVTASPQTITVTMTIEAIASYNTIYLPLILK